MATPKGPPPFHATVHARVCQCQQEPMLLGRAHAEERAVTLISGYWNVYLAFFGDQMIWLTFLVTDTRTGLIIWRNGRRLNTSGGTLAIESTHQD